MGKSRTVTLLESIGLRVPEIGPSVTECCSGVEPRTEFVFGELVDMLSPDCIVEFGSWEGRSALAWAAASQSQGLSPDIICVDTWLGSAEHWLDEVGIEEWERKKLRLDGGNPRIFETFISVAKSHGTCCRLLPFRTTTTTAAQVFARLGVTADIIYVDAAHDYDSVLNDLWGASTFLSRRGIICCDDFLWETVRRAGINFCLASSYTLYEKGPYAVIAPPNSGKALASKLVASGWRRAKLMNLAWERLRPPYHFRRFGEIWGVRDLIRVLRTPQ